MTARRRPLGGKIAQRGMASLKMPASAKTWCGILCEHRRDVAYAARAPIDAEGRRLAWHALSWTATSHHPAFQERRPAHWQRHVYAWMPDGRADAGALVIPV